MTDWASSGGVKVERAKEQIRNLAVEIDAFGKRRPSEIVPEKDAEGWTVYRVRVVEYPDPRWGVIAGAAGEVP
jgi:hypothetical protein